MQRGRGTKRRGCNSPSTPEAEAVRSDGDGVFLKNCCILSHSPCRRSRASAPSDIFRSAHGDSVRNHGLTLKGPRVTDPGNQQRGTGWGGWGELVVLRRQEPRSLGTR